MRTPRLCASDAGTLKSRTIMSTEGTVAGFAITAGGSRTSFYDRNLGFTVDTRSGISGARIRMPSHVSRHQEACARIDSTSLESINHGIATRVPESGPPRDRNQCFSPQTDGTSKHSR